MPQFKVLLEKPLGIYNGAKGPINPFSNFDILNPSLRARFDVREFIFEAESTAHVEQLLHDARAEDVPNVRGFRLRSIEEIAG